jgi:hypothetical protein
VKCNTPVPFTSVLPLHCCILFSVACLAAKRAPFASLLIVAEYGSCIVPGALSFSASSASVHSSSIPTRVVGASSLGLIQRGSKYAISRCSSLGGSSRDLSRGLSRDFERGSNTATFLGSSPLQPRTSQAQGWNIKLHSTKEWLCHVLLQQVSYFHHMKVHRRQSIEWLTGEARHLWRL